MKEKENSPRKAMLVLKSGIKIAVKTMRTANPLRSKTRSKFFLRSILAFNARFGEMYA